MIKNQIMQKIYKYSRSRSGKTVLNKRPIGVMIAGLDVKQPTSVCIGFSLCHPNDKYDYVKVEDVTIHSPGFGKNLATRRAFDWNGRVKGEVPPSILKSFIKFTERCQKYYQGANLPVWALRPVMQYNGVKNLPPWSHKIDIREDNDPSNEGC